MTAHSASPAPASYGQMFNTIVSTVSHDWAAAGDPAFAERNVPYVGAKLDLINSRSFHGDDATFLRFARYYLRLLGDPNFALVKMGGDTRHDWLTGFETRAAEDTLYVTESWGDDRLRAGDRIVAIDGEPLTNFRSDLRRNALYGDVPEREDWSHFLRYAGTLEVEYAAGGARSALRPLRLPAQAPRPARPSCAFDMLEAPDGTAARLSLGELDDPSELESLLAAHHDEIVAAERLVLDLRRCAGTPLDAAVALMPYLLDAPTTPAEFLGDQGLYVRYSHRNVQRMVAALETMRDGGYEVDLGDGAEGFDPAALDGEIASLRALDGAGVVWEDALIPEEWTLPVEPAAGPARVAVLSDVGCRSEGELLLAMAATQRKVVTVGRASLGNSDHQQLLGVNFDDDVFFAYPIGRTRAAAEGRGVLGRGVPVQVHVPWTPEELVRDLVLERALEA